MYRRIRTRILPILLVFVMLFCTMGATLVDRKTIVQTKTVTENGITYYVQGIQSGNKIRIIVNTDKDLSYHEISIDKPSKTISSTTYDYNGKGFLGSPQYSKKSEIIDYSIYEDLAKSSVQLQAISYKSKTTEKWPTGNDYWFCRGTDGAKTYLKIGCIASYQIRTDNLTSTKFNMCEAYVNAILNCNVKVNIAMAADSFGIVGCIAGIIACALGPVGVVVAACTFVAGCTTALAYTLIEAHGYYVQAKDKYNVIKAYGTKL